MLGETPGWVSAQEPQGYAFRSFSPEGYQTMGNLLETCIINFAQGLNVVAESFGVGEKLLVRKEYRTRNI